jgi:hypothetical protein
MKNRFGLSFEVQDYERVYVVDEVVKALVELPVTLKPSPDSSLYDLIYFFASGITGDQAKDVYKEVSEETTKRWGIVDE